MSCCVPSCVNRVQEWAVNFPQDEKLLENWKTAIQAGTGQCVPINGGEESALVCNMHFRVNSNRKAINYREPSLFYREKVLLEVSWCRLCFRYAVVDSMLDVEDCLTQGKVLQWMASKYSGLTQCDKQDIYFCKKCTSHVSRTKQFEHVICDAAKENKKLLGRMAKEELTMRRVASARTEQPENDESPFGSRERQSKGVDEAVEDMIVTEEPLQSQNEEIYFEDIIIKEEPELSQVGESCSNEYSEDALESHEKLDESPEKVDEFLGDIIVKEEPVLAETVVPEVHRATPQCERKIKRMCYFCDKLFKSAEELLHHLMNEHKSVTSLHCKECNLDFNSIVTLNSHLKIHDVRKRYKCVHCPMRFLMLSKKIIHEAKEHGDGFSLPWRKRLKCETCGKIFKMESRLIEHVQVKHLRERSLECSICNKSFFSLKALKRHQKELHEQQKPYKCKLCDSSFYVKTLLERHIGTSHNDVKVCSSDSEEQTLFKLTQSGTWTKQPRVNGKPVAARGGGGSRKEPVCNLCQIVFLHSKEIPTHFKEVHPTINLRYFPCMVCEEVYLEPSTFRRHFCIQNEQFDCDQCDLRLRSRQNLEHHRYSKHGVPLGEDRYVKCSECDEQVPRFRFISHMGRHNELNQLTFRPVAIDESPQLLEVIAVEENGSTEKNAPSVAVVEPNLQQQTQANRDMKVQHREELNCTYAMCGKSFSSRENLARHTLIHKSLNPYHKCKLCDAAYRYKYQLDLHIREYHKESPMCLRQVCYTQPQLGLKESQVNGKPVASRAGGNHQNEPWCNLCQITFEYSNEVVPHFIEKHSDVNLRYYPCTVCEEVFFQKSAILDHFSSHNAKYICDLCGKSISNPRILVRHRQIVHGVPLDDDKILKCSGCDKTFSNRQDLCRHIKVHTKKKHKCEECGEWFHTSRLLRAHRRKHVAETPLVCTGCERVFRTYPSLIGHVKACRVKKGSVSNPATGTKAEKSTIESNGENIVNEESQQAESESKEGDMPEGTDMTVSRSDPTGDKQSKPVEVKCSTCEMMFSSKEDMQTHAKGCEKSSQGKQTTTSRYNTGDPISIFVCDLCGKSLSSKQILANHRHIFHGEPLDENQFLQCPVCDLKCKRMYFTRHMERHEGNHFGCDKCDERFSMRSSLRVHQKTHEKPFACPDCGRRYSLRKTLKSHSRKCPATMGKK